MSYITQQVIRGGVTGIQIRGWDANDGVLAGDIVIPATINSLPVIWIYDQAFCNQNQITSITLPDVQIIGNRAFQSCYRLVTVNVGAALQIIGTAAFFDCEQLGPSINLPASMQTIGRDAFGWCWSLLDINYAGNNFRQVAPGAFGGASVNYNVRK